MASTSPSPEKIGAFGTAILVALVLVAAWQLAYWTWVFVAPPQVASTSTTRGDVDLAAVAKLFGASAPGETVAASTGGLRLKGVIAPTPGVEASAIFSTGAGKDIAVYIDREVQPGVKLVAVNPDHVMVERAGVRSRVDLETARTTASAAASRPGARTQGFKLNVARSGSNNYSLSRKELDDALRDPGQLNHLGQIGAPVKGGVRMDAAPPNSLASKLGLQPGDVIKKLNGQPVVSVGDLARLYTQFAQLSMVQAEVQRGS
ncbi:MAG TPA: type II secretion system protein N, partial [Usitatibacter sp.]|nr:type II secretion system protein N [Usitatibacter sp.]